jgi:hypothetical protein
MEQERARRISEGRRSRTVREQLCRQEASPLHWQWWLATERILMKRAEPAASEMAEIETAALAEVRGWQAYDEAVCTYYCEQAAQHQALTQARKSVVVTEILDESCAESPRGSMAVWAEVGAWQAYDEMVCRYLGSSVPIGSNGEGSPASVLTGAITGSITGAPTGDHTGDQAGDEGSRDTSILHTEVAKYVYAF